VRAKVARVVVASVVEGLALAKRATVAAF